MVNEEIVPIGDIKTIIDKTAVYVAKLGDSFVNKVKLREGNNPKFNFFNDGDQYNAYYKNQVAENKAKLTAEVASKAAAEAAKNQPTPTTATTPTNTATTSPTVTSTTPNIVPVPTSIHSTTATTTNDNKPTPQTPVVAPPPPVKKEPTQPDPLLYILDIPDFMTPLELDTMRLTAQFVAKNGDSFFHELSNREVKNQQFDFLKPTNHLYEWFRALVESYAQIIYPPMAIKEQLKSPYFTDKQMVLERAMNRCEYNQSIEMEKQKKEEQEDQEKSIIASIDWHDFVIVDTIEFNEDDTDDLPAPKSFDQLISGDISSIFANNNNSNNIEDIDQDNQDMIGEDDNEMEMEMEMDTDDKPSTSSTVKDVSKLKIVKDYQKPTTSVKSSNAVKLTQICQFCKQEIPLSEMQEHTRIELIQKQQRDSRNTGGNNGNSLTNTLSSDDDIARNLQSFASKRADIFGESEHHHKKQEEQNQAPKVIWDGHSGSIPKVQAAAFAQQQAQQQAAQQKQLQQQQQQAAQAAAAQQQQHYQPPQQQHFQSQPPPPIQNMMPPMPPMPPFGIPGMMPPMPPMPPFGIPGMMPPMPPPSMMFNPNQPPQQQIQIEEPNSKKIKIDDQLIPESIFLQSNPQPVKLICEMHDKSATYEIVVQPTDLISALKEQIKQKNGLASNKQKLQAPGLSILKDTCSIAFYNLRSNTIINVGLKERGGKKK